MWMVSSFIPSPNMDTEDGTCGAKMALSDKYLSVFHIAKWRPLI